MRYTDEWILAAMQAMIDSADDTGCGEDLTVTRASCTPSCRLRRKALPTGATPRSR